MGDNDADNNAVIADSAETDTNSTSSDSSESASASGDDDDSDNSASADSDNAENDDNDTDTEDDTDASASASGTGGDSGDDSDDDSDNDANSLSGLLSNKQRDAQMAALFGTADESGEREWNVSLSHALVGNLWGMAALFLTTILVVLSCLRRKETTRAINEEEAYIV